MKKLAIIFLATLFCPILVLGQSNDLFYSYGIPTYDYHSFIINSQDLVNYSNSKNVNNDGKETELNFSLQFDEFIVQQTPKQTSVLAGSIILSYDSYKRNNNAGLTTIDEDTVLMNLFLTGFVDNYLGNERGAFVHFGLSFLDEWNFSDSYHYQALFAPIGFGYGRVIGVKNVAQAFIINDELKTGLSDEKILELAVLIEKHDNGFYEAKFRDDSEIKYYDEISAILGTPAHAMKIDQILNSNIYKTSNRFVGWQVMAGINNSYVNVELFGGNSYWDDWDYNADLFVTFEYSKPLDFNKQFLFTANYTKPLGDLNAYRAPKFGAFAKFTLDHDYTWASALSFNFSQASPENLDKLQNLSASISTDKLIFNTFAIFASFNYEKLEYEDFNTGVLGGHFIPVTNSINNPSKDLEFHLGFKYYIM